MYKKAEITLIGDEVDAVKGMLKERIRELNQRGKQYDAWTYISVLDKIVDATRELEAERDPLTHETEKLRARLAAVEALIDKHPLGGSALIPATELRAALDI